VHYTGGKRRYTRGGQVVIGLAHVDALGTKGIRHWGVKKTHLFNLGIYMSIASTSGKYK
jgi:hypothetical protein